MSTAFLNTLVITGFGVAFFHAALPTHWLPFVLAARGQSWGRGKTLTVTAVAGLGHIVFTIMLGALVLWAGLATQHLTGDVFPFIAGGFLLLFGAYYLFQQSRGAGHGHYHSIGHDHHHEEHSHPHPHHNDDEDHSHSQDQSSRTKLSDTAVILGLLGLLTFSPCEGFLPVYLSGVSYGWSGFLILSVVLALATLAGMVLFTWLTLAGLEHIRFSVLERYESGILGGLLILLGIAIMVFER
jgi:ABC-type nickel/cobalt efflux system permease component RcnA